MEILFLKKSWKYPLVFAVVGVFLGLLLRYFFTGNISGLPYKNILHAHSHIMLLGFLFNAMLLLLWEKHTVISNNDRITKYIFIGLQICVLVLAIAFVIQGYAFMSILFSTLHLWLGYMILIRLWNRLNGTKNSVLLIKIGIVFYFIASLGPYMLAPLKLSGMQSSPWYQQAIFFYLHFQYLGTFFLWSLALLFQKLNVVVNKKQVIVLTTSSVLLYAHSLAYSFQHIAIYTVGFIGAILLLSVVLQLYKRLKKRTPTQKIVLGILLLFSVLNIIGSVPLCSEYVAGNRFVLIAYLHFIFLGMYLPFVWWVKGIKIDKWLWILYAICFISSELLLMLPSVSSSWLLFLVYLGLVSCVSIVHLKHLIEIKKNGLTATR